MDKFDALLESLYSDRIAKLREDKRKISESKKALNDRSKNITIQIKQLRLKELKQKASECKDPKRAAKIQQSINKLTNNLK